MFLAAEHADFFVFVCKEQYREIKREAQKNCRSNDGETVCNAFECKEQPGCEPPEEKGNIIINYMLLGLNTNNTIIARYMISAKPISRKCCSGGKFLLQGQKKLDLIPPLCS